MDKILVAVDGSESANRALMKAKKIGTAFNSKITILHVIEDVTNPDALYTDALYVSHAVGYDKIVQKNLEEQSAKLLDSYMDNFKDYTGQVDTLTAKGKPGDTIIKVSKDDYNLIVMGHRGLGALAGAMLGSVSHKVVNKSAMSVLIVK